MFDEDLFIELNKEGIELDDEYHQTLRDMLFSKDDSNVKINAFDILTLDELFTHTCTKTLKERQELLQSGILKEVPGKIEIVKSAPVVSKDNILKVFKCVKKDKVSSNFA